MEEKIQKINELLQKEEFVEELKKMETDEQVCDLFVSNGATGVTIEDVEQMVEDCRKIHGNAELNEDDLTQVAGGILITASAAIVLVIASAEMGFFAGYGYKRIKQGLKKSK